MLQNSQHPQAKFEELIDEIYRSIGHAPLPIEASNDDVGAVEVIVDDAPFLLVHRLDEADKVVVYCRFGPIPDSAPPHARSRLLELNLALAESNAAVVGIDPESGEVVYTFKAPLLTATGESVLDALVEVAELRQEWRSNWFMKEGVSAAESRPAEPMDGFMRA